LSGGVKLAETEHLRRRAVSGLINIHQLKFFLLMAKADIKSVIKGRASRPHPRPAHAHFVCVVRPLHLMEPLLRICSRGYMRVSLWPSQLQRVYTRCHRLSGDGKYWAGVCTCQHECESVASIILWRTRVLLRVKIGYVHKVRFMFAWALRLRLRVTRVFFVSFSLTCAAFAECRVLCPRKLFKVYFA
jgi:hypothetical protein